MTPAERKAKERQRRKEAGEILIQQWVPAHKAQAVKDAIAEAMQPQPKLSDETFRGMMDSMKRANAAQDRALAEYRKERCK